jgi:indole-3-glycerol phosphate synthase
MASHSHGKNILDRIVEARRETVAHRKRVLPEAVLKIAARKIDPPRDFERALVRDGVSVIAELKKASPSRGVIRQDYRPVALAPQLERAGAAALSVLTEEDFFSGSLEDLKVARQATAIPVLRKDFIIDPWQVWEARAAGADSFLLITAILDDVALREMLRLGRSLEMEPLVEVHSRQELDRALTARARIIGVNNRDLRTFEVRLETSLDLVEAIPEDCVAVSESGLHTQDDLARLRRAGFDAFLIGEQLMREADPSGPLSELIAPVGVNQVGHRRV